MINARSIVQWGVRLYYKVVHRVTVHGAENLPVTGPFVVASNHISNHDPILLAAFLTYAVKFMAKDELFRIPLLGRVIARLGAFPVNRRGLGIGAIRQAIRLLNKGDIVGIFPEGTRNRYGRHLPYKPGVGFIATRANFVPIVPVLICSESTHLFRKFYIVVGDPITTCHTDYRLVTEHVMQAIHGLRNSLELHAASYVVHQTGVD